MADSDGAVALQLFSAVFNNTDHVIFLDQMQVKEGGGEAEGQPQYCGSSQPFTTASSSWCWWDGEGKERD